MLKSKVNNYSASLVIIITILVAVIAFFYLQRSRPMTIKETIQPKEMLRAGSPDFEHYRQFIGAEGLQATQTSRVLGDIVMELTATVRNSTDRTINELEIRGYVVNEKGESVGERTISVIPKQQALLKPDETMNVRIVIEGIPLAAHRKGIHMDVTGMRFE